MAPGRMPRRRKGRQSAALFQSITRDEPGAHARSEPPDPSRDRKGAQRLGHVANAPDQGVPRSRLGLGAELLVAARRWWGRWSGRRTGPGPGAGVPGPSPSGGAGAGGLAMVAVAAGADRSAVGAGIAGTVRPLVDHLANGILQRPQSLASDRTLVVGQGRQGRVGKHLDGFAGIQADDPRSYLEMPDIHHAFIEGDEGGAIEILHIDIENGAAHRNQRGGRGDIVRIRQTVEVLDIDFDLAHPDVQEVAEPIGLTESNFGVGEDLKRAAIRYLEFGVPIGAGSDDLLLFDDA